jgi:excisionase family DNA binding protein
MTTQKAAKGQQRQAVEADTLLTVNEIRAITKLSRTTVYELIQDGHLEQRRIGRAVRVPVASFNAWYAGLPSQRAY